MAQDRISVEYSKKVSLQVADGKFETISLGGSVEFDVPEGQEWQESYEGAYITYKLIVDQLIDEAMPKPVAAAPATLPGEKIAPKPQSTWTAPETSSAPLGDIVPNDPVSFTGCKVFKIEVRTTKTNKEWAKVRIGNGEQIPGQYTTAKSFEPQIVSRLKALREGDMIDVDGYFEPWSTDNTKFDLVVQRVDRAA